MSFSKQKTVIKVTLMLLLMLINSVSNCGIALAAKVTKFGMNIEPSNYYAQDALYVDMLMRATAWSGTGPLTAGGYPTTGTSQSFFTIMGYPSGQYSFYGEGDFDLSFSGNYSPSVVPGTLVKKGNVTRCKVQMNTPAPLLGGFNIGQSIPLSWITISNLNPDNPPKNFRLIRPDYPADTQEVFGKEYLQAAAPFSCLRFMDWMNTNSNLVTNWASRPKPHLWGSGDRACSYEHMIDLANALNTDLWINIPLYATDDWTRNMANLLHTRLNPNLHVYYEVGNELWNWGFPAWSVVDKWAQADGFGTSWYGHGEEMGKLLMKWRRIMQPVLGSQGRPILAGQMAVTDYCSGGLHYIAQTYGPPKNHIWGISGATYVSTTGTVTSIDDVFSQMDTYLTTNIIPQIATNMALANQYEVKFTCYESGDGLQTSDENLFNIYYAAEQDPRMQTEVAKLVTALDDGGVSLSNFFNFTGVWTKFGLWSNLPDIRFVSNPTPKYLAAKAAATAGNPGYRRGLNGDSAGTPQLIVDTKNKRWTVANSPYYWNTKTSRWTVDPKSPYYKAPTAASARKPVAVTPATPTSHAPTTAATTSPTNTGTDSPGTD